MLSSGQPAGLGSLTPELLSEIFNLCSPSDSQRLFTASSLLAPMTLSYVCTYWRRVCLTTPVLWANIVLGYHNRQAMRTLSFHSIPNILRERLLHHDLPLLDLWLARAGTHPLAFKYFAVGEERMHGSARSKTRDYTSAMHILLNRLCARANYLHTVELHVHDISVATPILSTIQRPLDLSVEPACPLLEELRIVTELGLEDECYELQNLDQACPRLRLVDLRSPMIVPSLSSSFQNLRCLELEFCTSANHCMQWIDTCPLLETLTFRLFYRIFDHDITLEPVEERETIVRRRPPSIGLVQKKTRTLTHLTSLKISYPNQGVDVGVLLNMLEVPALKILELKASQYLHASSEWPHLIDLINCSRPPLEHLLLEGPLMNNTQIVQCLHLLPDLRWLGIRDRPYDSNSLFKALTVPVLGNETIDMPSRKVLCPALGVLDMHNSSLPEDILASLVASRHFQIIR